MSTLFNEKHYEAIAEVIHDYLQGEPLEGEEACCTDVDEVIDAFVDMLSLDNIEFKDGRFRKACGCDVQLNMDKIRLPDWNPHAKPEPTDLEAKADIKNKAVLIIATDTNEQIKQVEARLVDRSEFDFHYDYTTRLLVSEPSESETQQ